MSALHLWKALCACHRAQGAYYCRGSLSEKRVSRSVRRCKGKTGPGGAGLHRGHGSAGIRGRGTVSIVGAGNELLEWVEKGSGIFRLITSSISLPGRAGAHPPMQPPEADARMRSPRAALIPWPCSSAGAWTRR